MTIPPLAGLFGYGEAARPDANRLADRPSPPCWSRRAGARPPREAHLLLWVIEQDLMAAATGKKHELEVVALHGDPLLMTFQDFDWADEVLHAPTGREWIVAEFESREAAEAAARDVWRRYDEVAAEPAQRSGQEDWWPDFLPAMRPRAPVRQG